MQKIWPMFRMFLIITTSAASGAFAMIWLMRPESSPAPRPIVTAQSTTTAFQVATVQPTVVVPEIATVQPSAADDTGVNPIASLPTGAFQESFDGQPTSPQPWNLPNWDVTVHSRDVDTWNQLEAMDAMHGSDCGAPPATHKMSTYEGAVFQCRDHMMTAINASGYGAVYLTPNQLADFSQSEAIIRWDMSTLRTSGRDWVDLWISPFDEQLQLPLELEVDLSGPPRNAIQIRMDLSRNAFTASIYRDFNEVPVAGEFSLQDYDTFLTPDAKRRDTFEVRVTRTHISVGMPGYGFKWIDTEIPDLGWSQGVVQFGHHSYNPSKDCSAPCGPNTWHWDNIQIAPARPFTMIKADQRFVDAGVPSTINLARQTPENAHLRFAGIGPGLEVSFDDGKIWQPAQIQVQDTEFLKDEHFRSYWTPIPPGTQQVQFRGQEWWGGSWYIRDISVWAQ
jgi:hypothetical protein